MDELIISNNNCHWDEDDILGWVNIFFSLLYLDHDYQRRRLGYDKTKAFLWQLLKNTEIDRLDTLTPEVLTFFLIMHWPSSTSMNMPHGDLKKLNLAVKVLDQFHNDLASEDIKSYFKFCLVSNVVM